MLNSRESESLDDSVRWLSSRKSAVLPMSKSKLVWDWMSWDLAACVSERDEARGLLSSPLWFPLLALPILAGLAKKACARGGAWRNRCSCVRSVYSELTALPNTQCHRVVAQGDTYDSINYLGIQSSHH